MRGFIQSKRLLVLICFHRGSEVFSFQHVLDPATLENTKATVAWLVYHS